MMYKAINRRPSHLYNQERNHDIYIDRLYHGMTYPELSEKYGISRTRCRQIYMKYMNLVNMGVMVE